MTTATQQKDLIFEGVCFNVDWIKRHRTENTFVKKCGDLKLLSAEKAKELYGIVYPKVDNVAPETPKEK